MSILKELVERVNASGDTSPGQWNLVSDILFIAAHEACRWTNRTDDAIRIPDMLSEASDYMRKQAARAAGGGDELPNPT